MPLPDVTITLSNGNLGRLPANQDGVAGLIMGNITAPAPSGAALNTPYLIRSVVDAEALGIDEAYDVDNTVLAWHHIREFYQEVGGGAPLWIMITQNDDADRFGAGENADLLMQASDGAVRILASAVTDVSGAIVRTDGLPNGVISAIGAAKSFVARQFAAHKPCRVLLEGYSIESPSALTYDLRAANGPNADAVGVVIGRSGGMLADDMDVSAAKYASVGRVLGRAARIPVHYNLGRVKDGPLVGVITAGLSDQTSIANVTDAQRDTLNTLGYIFFRPITGVSGVYINDDHMATPIESDYSALLRGRVIDKAARITYRVYVQELNNDVELDTQGRLATGVVKNLEGIIESAIGTEMAGEISAVDAYIDPEQNILSTDELKVEVNIVPRGVAKRISVTLAYANPLANA